MPAILVFDKWENGDINPKRAVNANSNIINVKLNYVEVDHLAKVTFSGQLIDVKTNGPGQDSPGKAVTITVTKPDGTKDTLNATTDAAAAFSSAEKSYLPGKYPVKVTVPADSLYKAVEMEDALTLELQDRAITLKMVVT